MAKVEGNPKVNPEAMTVNGRAIKGWVVETAAGMRKWVELFKPGKVGEGQVARPLVCGDELPELTGQVPPQRNPTTAPNVNPPAPAERPPVPPGTPLAVERSGLVELRRTCNMNRNSGQTAVTIDYVLKCLDKP